MRNEKTMKFRNAHKEKVHGKISYFKHHEVTHTVSYDAFFLLASTT